MRNSEKWAALSVLVVSYACATGVVLDDSDYNLLNGSGDPGVGGSGTANGGSGGGGQSGSGPAPGNGGTGVQPGSGGTGAAPGQGGTGAAMGGSAGAMAQGGGAGAGQGGGTGQGGTGTVEPTGDCAPAGGTLQVGYINTSQSNQIGMMLRVVQNPSSTTVQVADVTLRYWFERDTFPLASWVGQVDYQSQANGAPLPGVTFAFNDALGYSYAELSFSSTNPIGVGLEAVNVRLHANYVTLDLTDDPSFDPAAVGPAPNFVVNENISAYVDGALVFGCEPEPVTP